MEVKFIWVGSLKYSLYAKLPTFRGPLPIQSSPDQSDMSENGWNPWSEMSGALMGNYIMIMLLNKN